MQLHQLCGCGQGCCGSRAYYRRFVYDAAPKPEELLNGLPGHWVTVHRTGKRAGRMVRARPEGAALVARGSTERASG